MVNEFDKEIDAMLRDLARGEALTQTLPATHLDADEISAFAENALPNKARLRVTEHLADCSKCRKILATTISFTSESESEIIHEGAGTAIALPVIPWYQKLFAFPNLSYAMGGLAVLLCGMIGILVYQSSQNSKSSQPMVAQKERDTDKSYSTSGGASSEGDAPVHESYAANSVANAPSAPMPTPAATVASPASNTSKVTTNSTDTAGPPAPKTAEERVLDDREKDRDIVASKSAPGTSLDLSRTEDTPKTAATPSANENDEAYRRENNKSEAVQRVDLPQQNRSTNQIMMPNDGQNRSSYPTPPPSSVTAGASDKPSEPERAKKVAKDAKRKGTSGESENILRVGGKSFRNEDGVWTDTSYNNGSTKTVKRNSDEYKKLDAGLQNIGNSFKGTVIVVWGGKNYKIQ